MPYDPDAPSSKRAVAELSKEPVRRLLMKIAAWSTGSPMSAEDLVQEAVIEVLDDDRCPWVDTKWTFVAHMTFAMRHIWDRKRRRVESRRMMVSGDGALEGGPPSEGLALDEEASRTRKLEICDELGRRLLADIGDEHPIARQVFELASEGVDEAADQAARIGCPIDEVDRARQLLKDHGQRVYHAWQVEEDRRRRGLRQTTDGAYSQRLSQEQR